MGADRTGSGRSDKQHHSEYVVASLSPKYIKVRLECILSSVYQYCHVAALAKSLLSTCLKMLPEKKGSKILNPILTGEQELASTRPPHRVTEGVSMSVPTWTRGSRALSCLVARVDCGANSTLSHVLSWQPGGDSVLQCPAKVRAGARLPAFARHPIQVGFHRLEQPLDHGGAQN